MRLRAAPLAFLQLAVALRPGEINLVQQQVSAARATSAVSRRAAVGAAATALALGGAHTATADDGAPAFGAVKSAFDSLSKPGIVVEYDGPYMDRDTGSLRYPVKSVNIADPVGGPVLLLGVAATRLGGILPDEMPFNVFQKFLRGVLPYGWFPDLSDGDFRKQFQDTWYGTNDQAVLPEFMKSRSTKPPTAAAAPPPAAADGAVADADADDGDKDAPSS